MIIQHGSANGLVPSDNLPIPEPRLTPGRRKSIGRNELRTLVKHKENIVNLSLYTVYDEQVI